MKNNKLKKSLAVGALTLAIAVPAGAGAASASVVQVKAYDWNQLATSANGFDWNAFIQQYIQVKAPSNATTGTGTGSGQTAQPSKPVTQPSKPAAQPSKPATTKPSTPSTSTGSNGSTAADSSASAYAQQVVTLVNQERAKAGLKPLQSNAKLTAMALDKAKDMYNKNYFDHTSPTYGSPFDMMKTYGISYRYAGENIAKGQRTPQEVMTAWMNSAGHKANILNANFTTIGVAYYNGEWVQEFIG
ncbi:CAP domain-containing protein [Cohnella faecalis]|uniref:SCP domain-containing protein n=1 Tax=Cohnella faecalis TaxID=2315694 RepID=A0A398CMV8_9BACL|nr:CAP domain-containing protein [Cohnella faecalis]RIE00254.1 hypothetical protein D3H35_29940 [Cohnella faecalis]